MNRSKIAKRKEEVELENMKKNKKKGNEMMEIK